MKLVFLDTETTGINVDDGHRVIELGATVVQDGMHTSEEFHQLLNPERDIDAAATEIHGFSLDDLVDQPLFRDVADDFLEFIRGHSVFMHNAEFDMRFLDAELERADRPERIGDICGVTDTLKLAKELHKNSQVNLDALCRKYSVDRSDRDKHGALLDSQLLAEVYLRMVESKNSLLVDIDDADEIYEVPRLLDIHRPNPLVVRATPDELAEHDAYMKDLMKAE